MNKLYFYIIGFFAFLWFIIRSGSNPKRLAYPCQQAAYPLAAAWLVAIAVPVGSSVYWNLIQDFLLQKARLILMVILGFVIINHLAIPSIKFVMAPKIIKVGAYPVWTSTNPVSEIFVFENIPASLGSLAAGDETVSNSYLNDRGVDSLLLMMQQNGTYFYKRNSTPSGIVGKDDIVIIKGNFQHAGRMSTNTDRIKGVIWAILNHPDGFDGEIIVADNGSSQVFAEPPYTGWGLSRTSNNSDDTDQDIIDVTNVFKAKGYPVDTCRWDNLSWYVVSEYSAGNMNSGYVYNATTKVNYPKFVTPGGKYLSLKNGVWDTDTETYDLSNVTIINMPVLKAHGIGGATIAVKNWVGIMTQMYIHTGPPGEDPWYPTYDSFHDDYVFSSHALPARVMDEIWPKLNILDATYTAIRWNFMYDNPEFVHTNTLLASTDPVAISWYSAKYILNPIAIRDNHTNPDYMDGDDSYYGTALNYWADYFEEETDRTLTKSSTEISVYSGLFGSTPARPRFTRSVRGNYTRSIRGRPLYYETLED